MLKTLIILLILCPSLLFANTYYVSQNGNDSNNGQGWDNAWATINKADMSIQAGDTVLIGTGKYYDCHIYGEIPNNKERTVWSCSTMTTLTQGNPILYGGGIITGWNLYQGNVYRTPMSNIGDCLIWNDSLMTRTAKYESIDWPLDSLVIPGVWDQEDGYLYFWPPDGQDPDNAKVVFCTQPLINFKESDSPHKGSYHTFWGLDLRGGSGAVINHMHQVDSVLFAHCNISLGCGGDGSNGGAIRGRSISPSDSTRWIHDFTVQACSLSQCGNTIANYTDVYSGAGYWRTITTMHYGHMWTTYDANNTILDSCWINGFGNGMYMKDTYGSTLCKTSRVSFNKFQNITGGAIQIQRHEIGSQIYGNIFDNIGGLPFNIIGTGTQPFCGGMKIYNNTIYNPKCTGITMWDGSDITLGTGNEIKYNIIYGFDLSNCPKPYNGSCTIGGEYITPSDYWDGIVIDSNLYYDDENIFGTSRCGSIRNWNSWVNECGNDFHSTFNTVDPQFNDPENGDFGRPNLIEMNRSDYGNRLWTKFGAIQSDSTIIIEPPDTTGNWIDTTTSIISIEPLSDTIQVGNVTVDRDGDNVIDIDDVMFLMAYVFTGGTPPPVYKDNVTTREITWQCFVIDGDTVCNIINVSEHTNMR